MRQFLFIVKAHRILLAVFTKRGCHVFALKGPISNYDNKLLALMPVSRFQGDIQYSPVI